MSARAWTKDVVIVLALVAAGFFGARLAFGPELARAGTWTDGLETRRGQSAEQLRFAVWDAPRALEGDVNTPAFEGRPALSPDGRSMVFAVGRAGAGAALWCADVEPGEHGVPRASGARRLAALDTPSDELAPAFGQDGYLYFASNRPGGAGGLDLWRARWSAGEVSAAEPLAGGVNTPADESDPAPGPAGALAFASSRRADGSAPRRGERADWDLYLAEPGEPGGSGEAQVAHLAELASRADEREPAFGADGRALVFASDRAPGRSFDLYRALEVRGRWLAPEPLEALNTASSERGPWPTAAGFALVFARGDAEEDSDLWAARSLELYRVPARPLGWRDLLALGLLLLIALFAWLAKRWEQLDALYKCALVSLIAHLLLLLWSREVYLESEPLTLASSEPPPGEARTFEIQLAGVARARAAAERASRARAGELELEWPAPAAGALEAPSFEAPLGEAAPVVASELPSAQALEPALRADEVAERAAESAQVAPPASTAEALPAVEVAGPLESFERAERAAPRAALEAPRFAGEPGVRAGAAPPEPFARELGASPGAAAQPGAARALELAARGAEGAERPAGSARAAPPAGTAGALPAVEIAGPLESFERAERAAPRAAPEAPRVAFESGARSGAELPARLVPELGSSANGGAAQAGQASAAPPPLELAARPEAGAARAPRAALGEDPLRAELPALGEFELEDREAFAPRALASAAPAPAALEPRAGPARPPPRSGASDLRPAPWTAGASAAEPAAAPPAVARALEPAAPAPLVRGERARNAPLAERPPLEETPFALRFGAPKAEALETFGGDASTERAVQDGLAYLARVQRPGGSWGDPRWSIEKYGQVAVGKTGLALLAFLGAGHVPGGEGEWAANAERAVAFLLRTQDAATGHFGDTSAYSHGIATYALAECYALTGAQGLRDPLARAVGQILRHQEQRGPADPRTGGWSYYYPDGHRFDDWPRVSISAWQVMALEAARLGGLEVPERAFEDARRFLALSVDERRGWMRYSHDPARVRSTTPTLPGSTPAGLFALSLLGEDCEAERYQPLWELVSICAPRTFVPSSTDAFLARAEGHLYFWYYGTLALFRRGGAAWQRWNVAMKETLLAAQEADGSWPALTVYASDYAAENEADRVYPTALCVLSLEIYYRYFTPLLQAR